MWRLRPRSATVLIPAFAAAAIVGTPAIPGAAAHTAAGLATPVSSPSSGVSAGSAADLVTVVRPVRGEVPPKSPTRPYATATFTVIVTNNGPNSAADVIVTNSVGFATLAGIKATPATVSCSVSTDSCTEPQLPSRASMTITVTVHYREFIHNQLFSDSATATSSTPDPNTANNSALGYYLII